jgi:hypothetical protein
MSQTTTSTPLGTITGPPYITLVDLDGGPVGPGSKNIPDGRPEPSPADSWPAWTDLVVCKLGRRDFDLEHSGPVLVGDAFRTVMQRAERPEGDLFGVDVDEGAGPIPDPLPEYRSPEEWEATEPGPVEPPDSWEGSAAAGWAVLAEAGIAPIAGGAPDFEPSEADLEDYGRWSAALDARRDMIEWYGRNSLAAFNADRAD